jgi:O-antigen ligase
MSTPIAAQGRSEARFRWAILLLAMLAGAAIPILKIKGGIVVLLLLLGMATTLFETWWLWIVLVAGLAFSVEVEHLTAGGLAMTLPTEAFIPLLFVIVATSIFISRRISLPKSPLNIAVVIWALAIAMTLPVSRHFSVSAKTIPRDLAYILAGYFLCLYFITNKKRLVALLYAVLAANVLLAIYGIATQLASGIEIYGEVAEPFFENHCIYAGFLCLSISVVMSFLFETRSPFRTLLTAVFILWCVAVVMTFVRGAWLSLLAVGVYYIWMYRKQLSIRLVLVLLLAGFTLVALAGTMELMHLFQERLFHAFDTGYVTNHDRLDRWGSAFNMFLSSPFLGVGWGAYGDEYFHYIYYLNAYSTDIRMGAHNLYLEIAAESGMVGLLAFGFLIFTFYRELFRIVRQTPRGTLRSLAIGLGGALISYLVHAVVNNLGPSDKIGISFWMIFGLLVVVGRLVQDSINGETTHARSGNR